MFSHCDAVVSPFSCTIILCVRTVTVYIFQVLLFVFHHQQTKSFHILSPSLFSSLGKQNHLNRCPYLGGEWERTSSRIVVIVPWQVSHCLLGLFLNFGKSQESGLCNEFSSEMSICVTYWQGALFLCYCWLYVGCAEAQCPHSAPVLSSPWKKPKIVPKSLFLPHSIVLKTRPGSSWRFGQGVCTMTSRGGTVSALGRAQGVCPYALRS